MKFQTLIVAAALLLLPVSTYALDGFPEFPMAFWGTVTINGSAAPVGSVVHAYYGSALAGSATVQEAGVYGYTEPTRQKLIVAEGTGAITFKIQSSTFNGGSETAGDTALTYTGFTSGLTVQKDLAFSITPPDTTPPSVTLLGSATTSVALGNTFIDLGATAVDDVDGIVTPVVSGSVDTNTVGAYSLAYTATDAAGNASSMVRNISVSATSLDVVTESSGGTLTGILTNAATLSTTTPSGNVIIAMPANLTVSGPSTWDGSVDFPSIVTTTVAPVPTSGNTASAVSSIEIGFGDVLLTFDKGVRILFGGQAGNLIGYSHGAGTFTPITNVCSDDSQAVGDALAAGADCKITVGSDLVVWTRHFSTFTTYTQTAIPAPAPTPTPSPAPSGGGGGGGGGGGFVPFTPFSATPAAPAPVVPTTQLQGQVLGASTYSFTKTLQRGSKGQDVLELQKILIAGGYLKIDAPTTLFGPMTETALRAYQKANGIESVGMVGPKTRALLNKGTAPSTANKAGALTISELYALLNSLIAQLQALKLQKGIQ